MVKKTNLLSDEFEEKVIEPISDEEVKEKPEIKEILPLKNTFPAKVQNILWGKIFLVDNNGKGISIPFSEIYKNIKVGDVIYL